MIKHRYTIVSRAVIAALTGAAMTYLGVQLGKMYDITADTIDPLDRRSGSEVLETDIPTTMPGEFILVESPTPPATVEGTYTVGAEKH